MNIKVDTIKSKICSIPKKSTEEAAKVGKLLISFKNGLKDKCLKNDTFQKGIKAVSKHKEAIVGYGAILAAGLLAIKCLKEIVDKVKETRKQ